MKRVIAILLCLLLVLCGTTACKPDTLTNPVVITDPDEQPQDQPSAEQDQEEQEDASAAPSEQTEEEQPSEETPEEESAEDTPEENKEEQTKEESPKEEEQPKEEAPEEEEKPASSEPLNHPFAEKDFKPSSQAEGTLKLSGLTKNTDPADALKDQTIILYTADDQAAFNYVNQEGLVVGEWDWMKATAKNHGFTLKLIIRTAETSLKAQRVALFAGKKLSLLQFGEKDLAAAMTLATSAEDHLGDATSYGVSKAVLDQSKQTIFAPKGMVNTLWYNKALMPQEADPYTLHTDNKWTINEYKEIWNASAKNGIKPQEADDELSWITLSGKSPLTLLKGNLDSNLNAKTTRDLWADLKDLRAQFEAFTPAEETTYTIKGGTAAMTFGATPERGEEMQLQWAPLPSMEEETAGSVAFGGTFMALPRYQSAKDAPAALTFAELWCNRYTEARATTLFNLGMTAEDYVNYIDFAEEHGYLIFRCAEIETLAEKLLQGAWDPAINQEDEYSKIRTQVNALIDRYNLYY